MPDGHVDVHALCMPRRLLPHSPVASQPLAAPGPPTLDFHRPILTRASSPFSRDTSLMWDWSFE